MGVRCSLAAPLAAVLLAGPALAGTKPSGGSLHGLGRDPGVRLGASGAKVRPDRPGDGAFGLDPPRAAPDAPFRRRARRSSREPWSVCSEARDCSGFGATLDRAVELAAPTSGGLRPLRGRCVWREAASAR